ncbi:DNA polymerase III subunit delta' [Sphingomonas xanthus]|uniref:DNA polymerase III subunit delta n=1 Tax=Sphingomonas xanthus TaxID=2594473 RepID=A0A516INZ6_9SPHN|nr:DNA polymerase III subunit delta' [Sphingomonas xanthus]QDP18609.1 DNA polymerase III subunit delta' [Sphingomonas xanthus]
MIIGQDRAVDRFAAAWEHRRLHHAWLLAGPRGVGKACFARMAATRVLADAAGPLVDQPMPLTPTEHPIARLLAAGSHPDFRWLQRLERPAGGLARNISVDQIRSLGDLLSVTPSMSPWRAIVIDAADDLEASAANALLKMLEEPPANTVFFLVSHAPGRLLPTIRSRCRRLDFAAIADDAMTSLLSRCCPEKNIADIQRMAQLAGGSVGRALAIAELDLAPLEAEIEAILRQGDADNMRRAKLATSLGGKGAADRYAAFLDLVPSVIAREALAMTGEQRGRALDAYAKARETAVLAPRLSLDPGATIFQLGTILSSVALPR